MSRLFDLSQAITELQAKLEELLETKALTDPEVLETSWMLDTLINECYRIILKKTHDS
ncbi:MAG: Spo0E family sporulation regulatory protein-aspartic acid phosphatase [Bacillota bacterium]